MRRQIAWAGVVLIGMVLLSAVAASASSSWFWGTTSYKAGEAVVFNVTTESTCWWCCNSCGQPACPVVTISGWRVADSAGKVVYNVIFDAPVAASAWQGTWHQLDGYQQAVAAGYYTLYVDASVGTLSLCFRITDPCGCGCGMWSWNCCDCQEKPSITNCTCKTTLAFVPQESPCACNQSLFGWFGLGCGCGCPSSSPCQQNP